MAFTVDRTGGGGLSYGQTRSRAYWSPTRGVRESVGVVGWHARLEAVALVLPEGAVFSHTTAAILHGLPLPEPDPSPFHVTVSPPQHRGRRDGVTWHRRHLQDATTEMQGLPVTSALRTFHDLADSLEKPDLVAVADVLLRRGLCTEEELLALFGVSRHRQVLSEASALADGNSWSPRESTLRVAFLEAGLPKPECNGRIIEDGELLGTGDWVWRKYRVIADYDGSHHDASRQRHQDAQTRNDYADAGWRHVALTKMMAQEDMVDRVARALKNAGWPGGC